MACRLHGVLGLHSRSNRDVSAYQVRTSLVDKGDKAALYGDFERPPSHSLNIVINSHSSIKALIDESCLEHDSLFSRSSVSVCRHPSLEQTLCAHTFC